jgi:hypothetical protein
MILAFLCMLSCHAFGGVYIGDCSVKLNFDDTSMQQAWPMGCIKGTASAEGAFSKFEKFKNGISTLNINGYGSWHFSRIISIHGYGEVSRSYHGRDTEYMTSFDRALFLGLGNQALTRWNGQIGYFSLPFGLNLASTWQLFDKAIKTNRFREFSRYSTQVSYLDLFGAQMDLALSPSLDTQTTASSIRIMKDLAALNGVRLVVSALTDNVKGRKIGFGMLNRSLTGSVTGMEFVRQDERHWSGVLSSKNQLIRAHLYQTDKKRGQYIFEYEDDFREYWMTTFGYRIPEPSRAQKYSVGASMSLYHDRVQGRATHAVLVVGMRGNL